MFLLTFVAIAVAAEPHWTQPAIVVLDSLWVGTPRGPAMRGTPEARELSLRLLNDQAARTGGGPWTAEYLTAAGDIYYEAGIRCTPDEVTCASSMHQALELYRRVPQMSPDSTLGPYAFEMALRSLRHEAPDAAQHILDFGSSFGATPRTQGALAILAEAYAASGVSILEGVGRGFMVAPVDYCFADAARWDLSALYAEASECTRADEYFSAMGSGFAELVAPACEGGRGQRKRR